MSLTREVGHGIRALRRRRGLTQAALAEMIDRSLRPAHRQCGTAGVAPFSFPHQSGPQGM